MLKSIILTKRDVTQFVILLPPDAPRAISTPSVPNTKAGVILFRGYLPGAIEFTLPGIGSYHIIPLFITTPVPLGIIPDPKPDMMVFVIETALPSESITVKCVVPESGDGALLSSTCSGDLPSSTQGFQGFMFCIWFGSMYDALFSEYASLIKPFQGTSACSGSAIYWNLSAYANLAADM